MRKCFNKLLYCVVFLGLNSVLTLTHAAAYDDFFKAVLFDHAPTVTDLLKRGFDPNARSEKGAPALVMAAYESSFAVMQVLLDSPKLDFEARNAQGESALMLTCLRGNIQVAKRLIAKDADINKTGWTPLHYAASGGHPAIIELLLENHAYIDAESPNGSTPLMMAAQYGSPEAVALLINRGADVSLRNQLKLNALDFAKLGVRPDAIELLTLAMKRVNAK